jgi:hypothetical protein
MQQAQSVAGMYVSINRPASAPVQYVPRSAHALLQYHDSLGAVGDQRVRRPDAHSAVFMRARDEPQCHASRAIDDAPRDGRPA